MTEKTSADKGATDELAQQQGQDQQQTQDTGQQPTQTQQDQPRSTADFDRLALEEAERLMAAEAIGGDPSPAGDQGKPQDPPKPPEQAKPAAPPANQQPPVTVPKARLDEALRRADEAERLALYHKAQADAFAEQLQNGVRPPAGGQGGGKPASQDPPPPSTAEQIKAKQDSIEALADKFDSGEITMREFKRQEAEIQNEIEGLRDQERIERVRAQQQPANTLSMSDEDRLREETDSLFEKTAELNLPWTEEQMKRLERLAREDAAAKGQPIGRGPRETLRLRQGIAEMAQLYGARWHGAEAVAALKAASPQPKPGSQGPGPRSPNSRLRQTELQTARNHPIDPNQLGSGAGAPDGGITEQQFLSMSQTELERLSQAQLADLDRRFGTAA